MYCAISTACLYPLETEKSLKILLEQGFRNFEFFLNCESEFSDGFLSELSSMLHVYNAKVCSVHLFMSGLEPYMFFSDYIRRFNDGAAQYRRYFSQAAKLGASVVVFHGDRRDGKLSIEKFCERFAVLSAAARDEGVTLAQENVARCRSATIESVLAMKRILGDKIKFVLDVKQALRADESPIEMCDAMGENIALVHLSDSTREHDCLLPGAGTFDIGRLRGRLAENSFDGPLVIEVYNNAIKSYDELAKTSRYMSKLL